MCAGVCECLWESVCVCSVHTHLQTPPDTHTPTHILKHAIALSDPEMLTIRCSPGGWNLFPHFSQGTTVDQKLGAAIAEGSKLRKLMSKGRHLLRGTGYSSSARNPEILELKRLLKRRDGVSSSESSSPSKSSSSEVSAQQLGYMDLTTSPAKEQPLDLHAWLSEECTETPEVDDVFGHAAAEAISKQNPFNASS
jgi:hypothetical protein